MPTPRIGASPVLHALTTLHEDSFLRPYLRVPLDDRGDIVELDFADNSAISDINAFECRRLNGGYGAKQWKRATAREIECSWEVLEKRITPDLNLGLSHATEIL